MLPNSKIIVWRDSTSSNDLVIQEKSFDILRNLVPPPTYTELVENIKIGHVVPDLSVFEKQIIYNLRKMDVKEIAELPDVSEGLEFSIKKTANSCNSLIEFLNIVKYLKFSSSVNVKKVCANRARFSFSPST